MKSSWQTKSLDETCTFTSGLWKGEAPPLVHVGVIRNTNFTKDGMLDDSDIAYLDVESKKFEKRNLQYGDIILEKSGGGPKQPVGRVAFFDKTEGNFSYSNFTSAIRIRNAEELDSRFLHRFLYWVYLSGVTEGMQSHSTGIRNLDGNAYKAIRISFPSVQEQERIVTIIDQAFNGIASAVITAEKNLANVRELFDSTLSSIFSGNDQWVTSTIGEHIRFIDYRGKTPNKIDNGLRLITAKNVKMGFLQNEPMEFVSPDTYDTWMTRGIPKFGDVLFTTEAPLANVAQLDTSEKVIFAQRVIVMQPDPLLIDSTFLKYALMSQPIQEIIHSKGTGATVKGIKASLLKTVKISFPRNIEEQNTIVAKLDKLTIEIDRLKNNYQQKLISLDELKKSILSKAFSGELY